MIEIDGSHGEGGGQLVRMAVAVAMAAATGKVVRIVRLVLLPLLARSGIAARLEVRRCGYYPRGGGEVRLAVDPVPGVLPLCMPTVGAIERIERGRPAGGGCGLSVNGTGVAIAQGDAFSAH